MKTRIVALAGVAALSLAACASGGDGGGSATHKVTVWMYPVIADDAASRTFWSDAEKSFEQANPTIDLTIELQPWDGRTEKVATAIASGKGPDLVLLTPDSLPSYVGAGGLLPLKDAQDPAFLPGAVAAATVDGQVYAVPIYNTVIAPIYNTGAFAKAGITTMPTTWDDLRADAPKLAAKGISLMEYSGQQTLNMSFYPFLWQAGGRVFSEDRRTVAFNSDAGKAALGLLVDLAKAGGLPKDAATADTSVEGSGLTDGKVAMTPYGVKADAQVMQKALGEDAVQVGEPLKDVEQVTFGLPGLLTRTSIGKDDASVTAVAKFLSSADFQTELSTASGFFPARSDASADTSDPLNAAFARALPMARAGEINPKSRQVLEALTPHLQAALQGKVSVDQALADAEKECNALLQQ